MAPAPPKLLHWNRPLSPHPPKLFHQNQKSGADPLSALDPRLGQTTLRGGTRGVTDGLDALTGVSSGDLCLAPRSDVTSCRGCMWQRSTSDESERSFDLRQFGAPRLSIVERTPHLVRPRPHLP